MQSHHNPRLQAAYDSDSRDAFVCEVVEVVELPVLADMPSWRRRLAWRQVLNKRECHHVELRRAATAAAQVGRQQRHE